MCDIFTGYANIEKKNGMYKCMEIKFTDEIYDTLRFSIRFPKERTGTILTVFVFF